MDLQGQNGLDRTYREGWRSRNWVAWLVALLFIAFYTDLYFFDHMNGVAQALGFRAGTDPSKTNPKWFMYGALYSLAMIGGAVYYLKRHGNSRYNRYRIVTNVSVQVSLAFALPYFMPLWAGAKPENYWKWQAYFASIWPLDWYELTPGMIGAVALPIALITIFLAFIVAPLAAFFFGKRWYCSWVCGCGALANTFGDPWRHLTPTSTRSWRFEQVAVHTVMFLAVVSTGLLLADAVGGWKGTAHEVIAGGQWWSMKSLYGYVVGAILAGVVGVGFYPLLGARIWCRNFCPMAALLGLQQKLGRFRIKVKPDMCISCGNCTTYCEMGIDVRSYAQNNESFTRAACVGCGMCAHMCPRGVLKLENVVKRSREKQRQNLNVLDL